MSRGEVSAAGLCHVRCVLDIQRPGPGGVRSSGGLGMVGFSHHVRWPRE